MSTRAPIVALPVLALAVIVAGMLLVTPLSADEAQTVANKTYDFWVSPSADSPPFPAFHDCATFTTTTMSTAICGGGGTLSEFPILGIPTMTLWIGRVPCGGLNLTFIGTSIDGTAIGFTGNVMSASGLGITEKTTYGVHGVENSSCTVAPGGKGSASPYSVGTK